MEETLPVNHPDMLKILAAANRDRAPKPAAGAVNPLANALAAALGGNEDEENIEFLVHVLSVNRAAGAIDDDAFARLLQCIETRAGRADLVRRFTAELEAEHGYVDEDATEPRAGCHCRQQQRYTLLHDAGQRKASALR